MRCWFYQVAEFEANMCRRGFGRSFTGKVAAARGLDPNRVYRLAPAVIAMGGANSADIAQEVHECILRMEGALWESERLQYGYPLPCGAVMCGVYLDDFAVVRVLARALVAEPSGPDSERV